MSIGLLMTLVGFVMAVTGRYGFDNNEIEKRKHNKHHMNYSCLFTFTTSLPPLSIESCNGYKKAWMEIVTTYSITIMDFSYL
jgi:hypothetical protein